MHCITSLSGLDYCRIITPSNTTVSFCAAISKRRRALQKHFKQFSFFFPEIYKALKGNGLKWRAGVEVK